MSAHSPMSHGGSPVREGPGPRVLPHTAGFTDGFGERKLMFDPATSTSLEVLRFKKEFSDSPDFEGGLLARVEAVSNIKHASLGIIHSVERISDTELALVSRHTPGRRVSELLPRAHGPAFALELIRLVTPALAALQRAGDDIVHGALSAERIVVTRDGRLVVLEHVMGSAIEALRLPRQKLNELGLVVPVGPDPVQFTARTDVTQLGFIALALLLGRRLNPSDYPDKVPALLDEFSRGAGSPVLAAKLRSWLERAMQISPRSFASAREAQAAFGELPDDSDVQAAAVVTSLDAFPQEAITPAVAPGSPLRPAVPARVETVAASRAVTPEPPAKSPRKNRVAVWIMILLGLVAAGEGVALVVMPYMRPAAEVIEVRPSPAASEVAADLRTATPAPPIAEPIADSQISAAPVTTAAAGGAAAVSAAASPTPTPAAAATPPATSTPMVAAPALAAGAPVAGPKFGGLTIASAMELQVFENGKLIGSTAGPIAINEGPRTIEVVNETLGFRFRQTVNVKGGQMTTVNIAVPNGRISINAAPWAEVDIDGKPAGETPLANLSLPIGSHEITFRHPEHGVKKQTVIVKVDGLTRVTQVFQPEQYR